MREKTHWGRVITFMGAFIAFSIGSGFASGQEILQYFASYGYFCVLTGIIFLAILIYTNCSFLLAGHREKFEEGNQIFYYYCGPYLGKFFDYFTIAVCYMSFVMMVSGAAATLTQQYGLPSWIGTLLLAGLSCLVVVFGLNALVDVIGKIGPILILFVMLIAILTLVKTGHNIPEGVALLKNDGVEVMQGGSNWFTSAIAYGGFALLWFPGFCARLAAKNKIKELLSGAVLGQIITVLTGVVLSFALIANIEKVAGTQVPSLILAEQLFENIALIFSVVIFLAIFSSATPLLWTTVVRFSTEKSKTYTILSIILAISAIFFALLFPFNILVNVIFMVNGYVGFIFVLCMVIKDIRVFISNRKRQTTNLVD